MKRLGVFAVTALALVAIFGSTALAARPDAAFTARANHADQGGTLLVAAGVRHGDHRSTFSASAVVHFASRDVSVDLTRNGRSLTAHAKVPVATDAAIGPVAVDVTITYGLTTHVVSVFGVIQPPDAND